MLSFVVLYSTNLTNMAPNINEILVQESVAIFGGPRHGQLESAKFRRIPPKPY